MTPAPDTCSKCGEPLESGSLGIMSYVGGASWYERRTALASGGEKITSKPLGGMVWLDGKRCAKCRLLTLAY